MNIQNTSDQASPGSQIAGRTFITYGGLLLCLLMGLCFLTACSGLGASEKETTAFSFAVPSKEAESVLSDQTAEPASQTQASETSSLSESSITLAENASEAALQATAAQENPSENNQANLTPASAKSDQPEKMELDRPTNPFSDQARIPLYARLEDADINDEPAVPMSVPKDNPIRGIAGSRVERFFRTLSVNPVTYHYAVLPSEGDLKDAEDIDALEVYIALKDDMAYMRIDTKDTALALLQLSASTYYQMDLIAGTYEILPGLTTKSNELSMDAFRQLETNAGNFISTGSGPAIFFGQKVNFEEFTADGASYVRYYFVGDVLVGHRRFEDGKIVRTVRVFEASNRYDEAVFEIPKGLKQVSASEPSSASEETSGGVTIPVLTP